jgi:amino acid adenylation domain-containing protein
MTTTNRRERLVHRLREIANDLSGMPMESLVEGASFLDLGFDSLFLTQLSTAYQKAFNVRITFRQLFDDLSTISALSAYIDAKLPPEVSIDAPEAQPGSAPTPVLPASATPIPAVIVPILSGDAPRQRVIHPAAPREIAPQPVLMPVAVRQAAPATSDGLEAVLLQQLDLMTAQLRLLQSLRSTGASVSYAAPVEIPSADQTAEVTPAVEASQSDKTQGPPATVTRSDAPVPALKMPSGFGPGDVKRSGLHPLPPQQQRHLDELIAKYTRKTAGSKQRTQQYRRVLADPRTAAGFNRRWKEMVYPIWVQRSLGSKLWDVDDNEYIDILNGFGPNFLGHSPDYIVKSIEDQLHRGFEIGPQTPLVGEVAEMICQLTGMDRVSFTCSGSEAVQAAMRLSRTVTGRDKIVVFTRDYHGNFDQVLVREANHPGRLRTLPSAPGIPFQSVDDTFVLEYGTDQSLEIIKKHADEIAAVIVEPVQSRRPEFQPRAFLHELRRITREAGSLLVFDEVVNGFRTAPGGAQAHFGIEADLATYGKIAGGGMPIGIVAGRSAVMDTFDGGFWQYGDDSFPSAGVTFFAGTFVRHPLTIAAAHAALKHLIREGPALQQRVSDRTARFTAQVNELFRKYAIDIEVPHFCSQMYLRVKEHGELANLLFFHLRYRGVHLLEGFPSYLTDAHSEGDLDTLFRSFTGSVEAMVEDHIFGDAEKLPVKRDHAETCPSPAELEPAMQSAAPLLPSEYPPGEAQREMWVAAQISDEASAASYGCNVVELVGDLNFSILERAVSEVVKRHEALHSTFDPDGAKVIVKPSMPIEVRLHDLRHIAPAKRDSQVSQILKEEALQVFDLAKGPLASFQLIRLAPSNHLLAFTAHMIVCDGWGFRVVLEEISALYSAYVEGREPSLGPANQMREYVSWQVQQRGTDGAKRCEDFWLSQFDTLPPAFELPSSRLRPPLRSFAAARENLRLTPEFCRTLKRVARELRNTPFALLLAAYQTWLHRLSGADDFVIGVPFAGQGMLGLNTLVGQCVHTLPFRVKVNNKAPFVDQLAKARNFILDAQENWSSNIGALVQELNLPSDPSRLPLTSVMFNLDPPLSDVRFAGCTLHITSGPRVAFHYDLGFNVVDEGEAFLVECDYNTNLFDAGTIRHWLDGFQAILEGIVADPKTPVCRLPILTEAERRERMTACTATKRAIPSGQTVHGLVSAQVARTPDSIAVEWEDKGLTYAELDKRSNQLANYLRAQGVTPNVVVAVCVNRSLGMVVGVLGALKAGGAFVAINPEGPPDRIASILDDTRPAVMLTHSDMLTRLPPETHTRLLCLDVDWDRVGAEKDKLDPASTGPEDLAYVCYTSGSTGKPKGVEISHGAVVNFLLSMATEPGLASQDVMLALTSLSFDIAVLEIFLPLAVGARIAIVTPQVVVEPADLDKAIERHGVTVMQATPATWRMLLTAGWRGNRGLKLLCGGESLSPGLAAELLSRCRELWNMYGPTETTVWSTICRLENGQPVTIGRPIANTEVYIVDDQLEPVPVGVTGELLIGGAGVARQYRNLPDLTAEKFISNPFSSGQRARLFRTGDTARNRPDGEIELVGRRDHQVKLRGHRVELGEIESILLSHLQAREAVVALREDTPGEPRLVAYVSCIGASPDGASRFSSELRDLARTKLPAYMLPSAFVVLGCMPHTPAGKVDRNALPPPPRESADLFGEEYTPPGNETEERLARLWSDTLRVDRVSSRANFFDLGGQSLVAVSLFAKIEKEFGRKLPLATLFASPTIEGLALVLKAENTKTTWSSLVPIQRKGSKPPLFLVHGAGGNVLLYRSLGECLAPEYPLYGLQSQGLDGKSEPLRTIEAMAMCYLREVRKVQPKGPYYLGGYCLGGTVAYEMAQILSREGEEVPLLAMLDTYNFSRALKVSLRSFLLQKAKFHLANLVHLRPDRMIEYLKEKTRLALGGELANLRTSMPGSSRDNGTSRATSGVEAEVQAINDHAAEAYDPKPYPGVLALFKPRFNYKFYPDPKMGWSDLALGGLDIVEVAVNPHSMLLEPYVQVLAAQLKERIDQGPLISTVPPAIEIGKNELVLQ